MFQMERIELNPRVCNGRPLIRGTRIPVSVILDQMIQVEVAQALRREGHDVLRASETGQASSDDAEILQKAIAEDRVLATLVD